jgi:hypothetical protein
LVNLFNSRLMDKDNLWTRRSKYEPQSPRLLQMRTANNVLKAPASCPYPLLQPPPFPAQAPKMIIRPETIHFPSDTAVTRRRTGSLILSMQYPPQRMSCPLQLRAHQAHLDWAPGRLHRLEPQRLQSPLAMR